MLAFRNGSIGNTLVAVPAMRALKRRYPAARLTVVVDGTGYELLKHTPWIDELIIYNKRAKGRDGTPYVKLVRKLRSVRPTHAVLFKRFFRNGLLSFLSGAKVRAGFETNGKSPFLNRTIPYDESVHIVDLNLKLAALLGAATLDRALELHLAEADRRQAKELAAAQVDKKSPYVVAHYGGQTTPPDFFPLTRFAKLLALVSGAECRLFAIGSGPTETNTATQLLKALPRAYVATDVPIRTMAALIEGATLFVGFNSGPAHVAAAVGTPAVVFYKPGPSARHEIRKWAPVGIQTATLVPPEGVQESDWDAFVSDAVHQAKSIMRNSPAIQSSSAT